MRRFFTAFANNSVFANILIVFVYLGGVAAVINMPLETFPDLTPEMIAVRVVWPGADPEEVEEGICRKIEDVASGLEGVKHVYTIASEHVGIAQIEVLDGYDLDEVKERVRNGVDSITTFPRDSERPVVEELIYRISVLLLALSSNEMSDAELQNWAVDIQDELRNLPEISQVEVLGARPHEIAIEVSQEKLREYGVTFDQVSRVVHANCINVPGGTMRTEGEEIRLRTMGRKYSAKDFADIIVMARPSGENITLGRIATISDALTEDNAISRFNGRRSISLAVLKTEKENIITVENAVNEYMAKKRQELPEGCYIEPWARMTPMLRSRISLLLDNGWQGLILVFILLWFFLDIRLSLWVGQGMPFSIAGALMVMWFLGMTINMISLFSMLIALGIIVDASTVVGESIYMARKRGLPGLEAAVAGVMEVGVPIFGSVLTTIVAFIPLMFLGGFMGKLIFVLPVVMIACMVVSLFECFLCFPAHLSHLPEIPDYSVKDISTRRWQLGLRFHRMTNYGLERFITRFYDPLVRLVMEWRYVAVASVIMLSLLMVGLVENGTIKFYVYPELDGNSLQARVEFPDGTPLETTDVAVGKMVDAIKRVAEKMKTRSGEPLLANTLSLSGVKLGDKGEPYPGTHWGTVRVELLDSKVRGIYFKDIMAAWERELGSISGADSITFIGDEIAPPGAPIELWLQGEDMNAMRGVSADVRAALSKYDGVYQIQDDFRAGKNELRLQLKPEARSLGFTVADLALQIHAGYYGQEVLRLQRGHDEVRVRVRYPADERKSVSDFEQIRVRSPHGFEVPLGSVADIDYGPGFAIINRMDGQRRVTVTAETDLARVNPNEVIEDLKATILPAITKKYPQVTISLQGEQENMRESLSELIVSYPLALAAIYVIMAAVFRSYVQALIILFTVPLGIIGAVLGHLALGYDLSLLSIFGLVALAGVVVNNGIVMIDCINMYLSDKMPFLQAVRTGANRRFRPVFLTTITTSIDLLPLIFETDFQAQVLIPMAISLAAGVTFAMLLTLLLVPAMVCILNDCRRFLHWLVKGYVPSREEVEPAWERYSGFESKSEADTPVAKAS